MEIKQTKTNTSSDGNLKKNWILSKCHFKMQVLNHNTNTSSDGKTNWENQIRLILQKKWENQTRADFAFCIFLGKLERARCIAAHSANWNNQTQPDGNSFVCIWHLYILEMHAVCIATYSPGNRKADLKAYTFDKQRP